jgi:glycosyltransferase involved in cell wall biosynthesis
MLARHQSPRDEMNVEPSPGSTGGIVALLPYLVNGALSLNVLRALRAKGADVAVAFCANGGGGYTPDPMTDFAAENGLIDLSATPPNLLRSRLSGEFKARRTRLALQIGAFALYPVLPYVKEQLPTLRVVDILYNEVGHTLNHFLYEACFDGVIVESRRMARFVRESTLKPDPNVRIVESGIDLDLFCPRRLRPDKEPLRIGYIGRLSPEKNPLGFIDLFERLAERLPGLRATIAGDGPMADKVRSRVNASPAPKRLTYLGRIPDVCDALRAIDVLVVPSKLDGRPNIAMEANACGVPVIGAPVGGIPELIEEGVNGYLAAPTETDRIATWLRAWDEDPSLLAAISSSSRKCAEVRFDRRRMIADYVAAFAQFAGSW